MVFFYLLVGAAATIIGLLTLFGLGWLLTTHVFKLSEPGLQRLLAPTFGVAMASIWLNSFGRWFGWWPAVVSLWLVGGLGGYRTYRANKTNRTYWLFFSLFVLSLLGGVFDEGWHFPLAGLIAAGHWPAQYPFEPSLALSYHYGFDIVVAYLSCLRGYVPFASDVLMATLQTTWLLTVHAIAEAHGLKRWSARLATMGFAWAGSLAWLLRPWRHWLPTTFAHVFPFHGSMVNNLFLTSYTKSTLIAATIMAVVILLVRVKREVFHGWRGLLLVAMALLATALSSETLLIIFAPVFGLAYLIERQPLARRWRLVGLIVIAVAVAFQGGLITDLVARLMHPAAIEKTSTSFSFGWRSQHQTFGDPIDIAHPADVGRLLLELAGFILLAMFAWRAWPRWNRLERALLVMATLSLPLPWWLHYGALDRELLRLWPNAFLITNLLGAIAVLQAKFVWRYRAAAIGLVALSGCCATILSNIPITWMASFQPVIVSRALWLPYLQHDLVLPAGSIIWTDADYAGRDIDPRVRQLPLAFGVYTRACKDLFNQPLNTACQNFMRQPSVDHLLALRVSHLLLTDGFVAAHQQEPWVSQVRLIKQYPDRIPDHVWRWSLPGQPGNLHLFAVQQEP